MTKKIFKFISLTLAFCMLISTATFAEESGAIKNMTYEEWVVEQEGVDSTVAVVQSELSPVKITSQKQEQESNIPQVYNAVKSGNRLLDSILREKGSYKLNEKINKGLTAENVTVSITSEVEAESEADTISEVSSSSEEKSEGGVDATSEEETVNEEYSISEAETVNGEDSVSEEETVNEEDSVSEAKTVNEEDSVSEEGSVSEEESVNKTDSSSEVNSSNKVDSANEADLARGSAVIRTAPTAGLVPIIVNEESLVNGQITTDTLIAFFFNDTDADGHTIVSRYVDGTAVNYILGSIDGGFVMQITDPGSYQLYYQVEDSAGEFSRVLGYTIDVIQAPIIEPYQVFEGNFSSADETITYNFSIDFSEMSSAAVCLVRKGYVGSKIEVFDESGNQVLLKATHGRQAKNWGFIDKPSLDATICNYTVVVKPSAYENRASDYRIIIGNKNDTELMMSGIENTVLADQYYEAKVNLQNSAYVPNTGEYWYKYKRESTSVITILSDASDIRFKILNVNTLAVMFDSATDSSTHKTSFTGGGSWICAEKARLNTVVGTEYYLVVYSTNPNTNLSLRTGSMGTAIGHPVMLGAREAIAPGTSVTLSNTGYSSIITCNVSGADLPNTAQIREITLNVSPSLSNVERWKMKAPNQSSWVTNPSSFWFSIDMNYKVDATSGNALLKGPWSVAFQASGSGKGQTITPGYIFFYNYEYGD